MSSLSRELVFLILQFLDEEKFKETVHRLEQESGFYFNMKHFEDQVQAGEWEEVERYLGGFTKVEDNRYSMKIFFEIRKQKYLEALDRSAILCFACCAIAYFHMVFSSFNEELFKEITQLLTLENFRQNEQLSNLNWQHQLCKNPRPNPDIKTLFTDHSCAPSNGPRVPPQSNSPLVGSIPKPGGFPSIGVHSPFQPVGSPSAGAIAGWMSSANPSLQHPAVAAGPPGLVQPPNTTIGMSPAAFLKHPRTPTSAAVMDYQTADSEHLMKRMRTGPSEEGSNVMSMDFHPQQQTILLVGTNVGDIAVWEVGSRERIAHKTFKTYAFAQGELRPQLEVWDAASGQRQYTFEGHESPVYSVCPHYKENIQFIFSTAIDGKIKAWLYDCMGSRVDYDAPGLWCTTMAYSADGTRLFSCGTSKDGDSHLVEWNETEGSIKRTYSGFRKRSLGVVQFDTTRNRFLACGDEFQIKFWDMDNLNILTTTDADGGLPASPRLRFNKEGSLLAVTTSDNGIKILANSDGQRLIRMLDSRAFEGSRGASQLLNTKPPIVNALGAVGNVSGPLSASERLDRLPPAVSINSLTSMENNRADVKPRISDDSEKVKSWKLSDIVDPAQLKALRLPDPFTTGKVVRLLYTNSGLAVLALASNAVHKLWKWQRTERNPHGKSTASVVPQLWHPNNGILMTNDTSDTNPAEEATACIALSKNDSYVMSASGGKVSLFNMMTFKVMTTFMPPPPAATFLAFHPQDNNIIAIGMDDSTIQIYNVRVDEVKTKLKGHQKKITGLAFSQSMNVLVSSGADAQLCVWSIDGWEKRKSRFIQAPPGRSNPLVGDTKVQFHNDQAHILVVHDSQLSIYDSKLDCLRSWSPRENLPAPVSSAIYSCDGLLIYAGFCDGAVGVFDADSLRLRCRIASSAYISSSVASSGSIYPMVIAAHPTEPNQVALGMSDGAVHVVEPSDSEPKWGAPPPQDNGTLSSIPSNPSLSNQASDAPPR
ncbi:Topless-related protein 1 [Acorus calamus]|uniref:Topless-related protein 1 n=1 Tax=Acorus calamus TaxID=4465 RepID=A0AAV9DR36_ACOCL|nr:Topless-related protein 1 [Acorus calamus]